MKMKLKSMSVLLMAGVLLLSMTACGGGGKDQTANDGPANTTPSGETDQPAEANKSFEVIIASAAEPESLDPQISGAAAGGNISYNLFDYLVRMSADGTEVIPCLAASWEQPDENTWRFYLREGVTFTNGEPFNAECVTYTLDRIFEPDSGRTTYNLKVLDSWTAVDEYTVDLHTAEPCNDMPTRLYDMAILPAKYGQEVSSDEFGAKPIGCGPYKLDEWATNNFISLTANEDYWDGAPDCKKMTFRTIPEISTRLAELMAGSVDIVLDLNPDYIETVNNYAGYNAVSALSKRVAYIGIDTLNADSPQELQDPRVRQALNYAVDRDAMIENLYLGNAGKLATIWREDYVGYDEAVSGPAGAYPYDPDKARQLLAEAGYADGFAIDLYYTPQMFLKCEETCLAVAGYLEDIGLKVKLNEVEYNALRAQLINGQDAHAVKGLFGWNWGAKPQTPDGHLAGAIETGGITSYYTNSEIDALIAQLRSVPEAERAGVAAQLQALLYEDCPYIFLWQQMDVYGISEKITWEPRLDQYVLGKDMHVK